MVIKKDRSSVRREFVVSFIMLIVLLTVNFFSWQLSKLSISKNTKEQFTDQTVYVSNLMKDRIHEHQEALVNGKKFYESSDAVERNEFANFFHATSDEDYRYSGQEAVIYVERVQSKDKDAFISKVRQDKSVTKYGYPFFNIQVNEPQDEYLIVNYIEPYESSKMLFGYDVASDPALHEYFNKARDTENVVITPEIQFMNAKRILLIESIYANNKAHGNLESRREAVTGFLVVVLRADRMFDGILINNSTKDSPGMSFAVYDGAIEEKDLPKFSSLYEDSNEKVAMTKKEDMFTATQTLDFGDRKWTAFFSSNPQDKNISVENKMPDYFFFGATGLSFLMFILLSSIVQQNHGEEEIPLKSK